MGIDSSPLVGPARRLKRIAYNVAWMKIDPLWVAIIRAGLMPFASRIFERMLRVNTKMAGRKQVVVVDKCGGKRTNRPTAH